MWMVLTQQIIWAGFTFTALTEKYFHPLKQVLNNSPIILHAQGDLLRGLQGFSGFLLPYIFVITADDRVCNVRGTWLHSVYGDIFLSTFLLVKQPQINSKTGHLVCGSRRWITFLHLVQNLVLLSRKHRAEPDNFRPFLQHEEASWKAPLIGGVDL